MSDVKCLFCGEPRVRECSTYDVFRCGTEGPDINGEYYTGHVCEIATYLRLLKEKDERLAAAETENARLLTRIRRYEPEPGICEHGVTEGDWCEPCNREHEAARAAGGEG